MSNRFAASFTTPLCRPIRSLIQRRPSRIHTRACTMPAKTNGEAKGTATPESGAAKRKLKILMLHGYTQSGSLFHAKTRALEKILAKAFPSTPFSPLATTYPGGIQLFYPTAPIHLRPADIPGYTPSDGGEDNAPPDAWGWWKRETGGDKYVGIEEGLNVIADSIREAGGIDGVIGFSQGGAAAALVASLLEPGRPETFLAYKKQNHLALEYPASFETLKKDTDQAELKFAVSYSGFYAPSELYKSFYEPKIRTKMLHVIGSLDSVVEESRSTNLVEACVEKDRVLYHPGGHFVPIGKEISGALVGFIRECCEVKKEESAEDMDVPF